MSNIEFELISPNRLKEASNRLEIMFYMLN